MKYMKFLKVCAILTAAFFIAACDWENNDDHRWFARHLQGTWESVDPSVYSGTLEITFNRITIRGYAEAQTQYSYDDNRRPFRDFLPDTPLTGFPEEGQERNRRVEGNIFIEHLGLLQAGIPYVWYEDSDQAQFLSFNFGGRYERLRRRIGDLIPEPKINKDRY